jgi:hypothetical protein
MIRQSSQTFEKEVQTKILKLTEREHLLSYQKQTMIEDLEITIKGELKKLDDSRNVSQQIPILQYFEESDPEVKSQMMMSQFSDG